MRKIAKYALSLAADEVTLATDPRAKRMGPLIFELDVGVAQKIVNGTRHDVIDRYVPLWILS